MLAIASLNSYLHKVYLQGEEVASRSLDSCFVDAGGAEEGGRGCG